MKNTWIQEKDKDSSPTLKTCQKIVLHHCVFSALNHIKPLGISSTSIQNGCWNLPLDGFKLKVPDVRSYETQDSGILLCPGFLKNGRHFLWEQWFRDVTDVLIYWDFPDWYKMCNTANFETIGICWTIKNLCVGWQSFTPKCFLSCSVFRPRVVHL